MPSAIKVWRERIEAHDAQTLRARAGREYHDMWDALATNFKDDPHRDDPIVNFVDAWLRPTAR